MCICRYMFCICCGYYMLIFFYRWFEFSMDDKISRVKILRGFLFPSLQFRDFFYNRKNTKLKTHKVFVPIRYVIYLCLVYCQNSIKKSKLTLFFKYPVFFKRCEYKSKSGRFLWQSEEYSLKTVQLLLSEA